MGPAEDPHRGGLIQCRSGVEAEALSQRVSGGKTFEKKLGQNQRSIDNARLIIRVWVLVLLGLRYMRPPVLLGFLAVLSQIVPAQVQPDVAEILKEVSQTYTGVSQYEFDA